MREDEQRLSISSPKSLLGDKKKDGWIVQQIMRHASAKMPGVYQHGANESKRSALEQCLWYLRFPRQGQLVVHNTKGLPALWGALLNVYCRVG